MADEDPPPQKQQPPPPSETAAEEAAEQNQQQEEDETKKLLSSYLGLTFSLFLASLPNDSLSLLPKYQTQLRDLSARLYTAEEQLRQMKSRRKEDSKANARVVEIFASHRNAWQAEERRLLQQIDAAGEEIVRLRGNVEELEAEKAELAKRAERLEREVGEREEIMISFMSSASHLRRRNKDEEEEEHDDDGNGEESGGGGGECEGMMRECYGVVGDMNFENFVYQQQQQPHQQLRDCGDDSNFGFGSEFFGGGGGGSAVSKFWAERAHLWQDVQCESLESQYQMKHFVARRESPWKVDGESNGVSSKLKLLEQELLNLENLSNGDLLKAPSAMRKQAKRYQALAGKIDDLCRRMQASDPCDPALGPEFRTQRQTEFLLEAFRLQHRATETSQKLIALQTEIGKSSYGDELLSQAKLSMRRSMDAIRNNLKEIQRNLEIWLARIIGDLEGLLARDGASRVKEYCISRYPFVQ